MYPRRKPRELEEECPNCFGCGHICDVCEFPINACRCVEAKFGGLDCEAMRVCEDCKGVGRLQPEPEGVFPQVTAHELN
jgi:hypothetical protein